MRIFFLFFIIIVSAEICFSFDLGAGLSVDYYNNPIVDSAPSPIQQRPIIFHNLSIGVFNLRSGFGLLEGYYEVSEDNLPVFNDVYNGFYTIEVDIFTYPGILINLTDSLSIGIAGGGGVRLPFLTKIDSGIDDSIDVDSSFDWFYTDLHFIFWGAQIFTEIKLPLGEDVNFYGSINYKDFIYREDQWLTGATIGLLWHL